MGLSMQNPMAESTSADVSGSGAVRPRRWRRVVVRGVLALLGFVLIWYVMGRVTAPLRQVSLHSPAGASAAASQSRPLKVMAYNIAHGRGLAETNWAGDRTQRLGQIAELIREQSADIVVLNEVDFDSSWSGRDNQAQILAEQAGYDWRAEQVNYDLSLPGFRICFGNAVLSRFPITQIEPVRYASPGMLETMLFGQKDGLICTIALPDGKSLRVLAVHMESRSKATRLQSLEPILTHLRTNGPPMILAGDFNSILEISLSPPSAIDRLVADGKLIRPRGPSGNSFRSDKPEILIDHILVQPPWRIEQFRVLDSQLSDHRPVIGSIHFDQY